MKSFSPQYSWNPSTYTPEEKEQERKTSELMIRKAAGGWDTDGEWERAMGVTPIGQLEDDENSLGAGRRLRGGAIPESGTACLRPALSRLANNVAHLAA